MAQFFHCAYKLRVVTKMRQMKDTYHIKIHKGGSVAWDASDVTLSYIQNHLTKEMHTCETGAGKTSLVFAKYGAQHTVVTPSQSEIANIKKLANDENIDLSNTRFITDFSQNALPNLNFEQPLDIVLIDGGHGFPIPQIDFVYLAPHLKIGGKLLIDDIDLWTGKILVDFLRAENGWRLETTLRHRTAIFTKTGDFQLHEWCDQNYVLKKSRIPQFIRKARNALEIILNCKFSELLDKLKQEGRMGSKKD